ncbi:MAG: TonB-dependent receptor [Bacteroidales bacterium]|nr:TonB-dependent receptor [Bacteroidales bacterium]
MTTEELSDLPMEDLMEAVETLGVSSIDELFSMIMNKNVSSASKEEENSFTSPLSTTVITKAEMRTYGVTTIEEAFRLIPGMIITEKVNGGYDVQMRGLNNIPDNNMLLYTENSNTLLMVDSRPVQNCAVGALTFEFLPISIEDIERIEVVRGACGALYGANAVSGVINIITEKPSAGSKIVSGNIQVGNNNTCIGDVALRGSWLNGKLNMGLSVNMQHRGRATSDIPLVPSHNRYIVSDELAEMTRSYVVPNEQIQKWVESGDLIPANNLEFASIDVIEHFRNVQPQGTTGNSLVYNTTEPETPISNHFRNPDLARKNEGYNAYISFVPSKDVRFDLSGGYQRSFAMASVVGDDAFSLGFRSSKTGYINMNSNIHDLSINVGYEFGPQDYAVGAPGFKVYGRNFNASAEYTIKVGGLGIKPGLSYNWVKYEDYLPVFNDENRKVTGDYSWQYVGHDKKPADTLERLYGFFDTETHLYSIAPGVRLDYKLGDMRLIGAFRSDKTRVPNKWNHSWQFAANYEINDNNFIRLVYGRANRGACLVNTSSNFQWRRTNMTPQRMVFVGNPESDLVYIDNIELGYRVKPSKSVLIDAEFYYSLSKNYNALMSHESMMTIPSAVLNQAISEGLEGVGKYAYLLQNGMIDMPTYQSAMMGVYANSSQILYSNMESRSYIEVGTLPYKVNQYGLSVNVDWIISPKLIAKLNANVQQTRIDNYYEYSQGAQLTKQLSEAQSWAVRKVMSGENGNFELTRDALATINEIANTLPDSYTMEQKYAMAVSTFIGHSPVEYYNNVINYYGWSDAERQAFDETIRHYGIYGEDNASYNFGDKNSPYYVERPVGMYYALKYKMRYIYATDEYFFGSTLANPYQTSNGHKHKATPSIYGMIGLIYKPMQNISASVFANFTGKRTYQTSYGSSELPNRCTVNMKLGYKPISDVEIFFNAHNLFNSEKREFVYADKIGGLYTVGVNFGL